MKYAALIFVLLCSCARPSQPLDAYNSYRMIPVTGTPQPRAFHGKFPVGDKFTSSDAQAVRDLHVSLTIAPGCVTGYGLDYRLMCIEPTMPRPVLLHEATHVGTFDSPITTTALERESLAMVSEVACLMQEGWSDARIRALSPNNIQTPAWVFNWIRANGPHFTGTASDVSVAYAWGKSSVAIEAVRSLVTIAPSK